MSDIEGNQLRSDCGTDIGSHHHAHSLIQGHDSSVYQPYHHHCRSGGTLDQSGDAKAH